MKSPAFQWYPGDYLASQRVQLMSLEEEGAYIRLLCFCWVHGSIPSDPDRCARLIGKGGSTTLATTLLTMFQPDPNDASKMVHDRLEIERKKQSDWRQKSVEGGKNSAALREKKRKPRVVQPPCQPNGNSSPSLLQSPVSCLLSISPTPDSQNNPVAAAPLADGFDEFWQAYPKKAGKGDAVKSWRKLNCAPLLPQILTGIRLAKASDSWTKDGGQFIPHPATWLNRTGWEDDPSTWATGKKANGNTVGLEPHEMPRIYVPRGNRRDAV